MELRDAILGRRSVRSFRNGPIPEGAIGAMKESILWAPSAGNIQARRFYFVTDPDLITALGGTTYQSKIFTHAPLVIAGCADHRIVTKYKERGRDLYAPQDVAASVQNLLLTVHGLGLGAVWIGAFREEQASSVLDLPDHLRPVALVPVGRPAKIPDPPKHLPASRAFVDLA